MTRLLRWWATARGDLDADSLRHFNDWHLASGARLGRTTLALLVGAAALALALSAVTLVRSRRPSWGWVLVLRAGALAACLGAALQPNVELREIVRVPNRVAVLVDASRSMEVRPPDGGPSRAERAAQLLGDPGGPRAAWERDGHRVDIYTFGAGLVPSSLEGLRAPPTTDGTRIGEALAELGARYAGHDLGAVVVVSDGIDTGRIGRGPVDAETRAAVAALGVPVHTVGIGEPSLRDLSIATVMADEFAFVRTPVTIEAMVRQHGLPDRQVDVTLTRDGRLVGTRNVVLRGEASEDKVSFDWVPDQPGTFVFQIATPVLHGEALASNNAQLFTVKVIRDRVRVLHVCGRPSWDERFLRAMLRRDPNVDLVSFYILRTETDEQPWNRNELSLIPFPQYEIFEEQLHSFDLVIFQNFNFAPYGVEPFLSGIREYVEQGGALAMIGGDLSFASGGYGDTPLREILPVELARGPGNPNGAEEGRDHNITTDAFKPRLTDEGRAHPVTSLVLDAKDNEARWGRLPLLEGINEVIRMRPGALALLVHPTLRIEGGKPAPVLAVTDAGKGRSLALLTDTAWHWGFVAAAENDDGRTFQRFWENAIRWLVRDPALTLLRIDLDRVDYRRQQSPAVRVRAMHADYSAASRVTVTLAVRPSDAAADAPPVRQAAVETGADGEGHVELAALPPGAYRLTASGTLDGRPLTEQRTFVVRSEGKELDDVVFRDGVLRELAEIGGGTFRMASLDGVTIPEPQEVRIGNQHAIDVWSNPLFLLVALGLLGAEWTLRRRVGLR
jgi:uncharacterized membrane protein